MGAVLKKRLRCGNNWLYNPSWLGNLDNYLQALLLDVMHLRDQNLWYSWWLLVIPLIWLLSCCFLPFLYLVDLVLQLDLLCVEDEYLVCCLLFFIGYFHFILLHAGTHRKAAHLSLCIDGNQLLLTVFLGRYLLLSVVVVEKLLYGARRWFLRV